MSTQACLLTPPAMRISSSEQSTKLIPDSITSKTFPNISRAEAARISGCSQSVGLDNNVLSHGGLGKWNLQDEPGCLQATECV